MRPTLSGDQLYLGLLDDGGWVGGQHLGGLGRHAAAHQRTRQVAPLQLNVGHVLHNRGQGNDSMQNG